MANAANPFVGPRPFEPGEQIVRAGQCAEAAMDDRAGVRQAAGAPHRCQVERHAGAVGILQPGDHVVASSLLYGGTYAQFAVTLPKMGITTSFVNPRDHDGFRRAIEPATRLVQGYLSRRELAADATIHRPCPGV